jgi:hypothetical protein
VFTLLKGVSRVPIMRSYWVSVIEANGASVVFTSLSWIPWQAFNLKRYQVCYNMLEMFVCDHVVSKNK